MGRWRILLLVLLLGVGGGPLREARAAPPSTVAYTVAVADIPGKLYQITIRADGLSGQQMRFAIPAWTPGYYVLTNFQQNIRNVQATGPDGAALPVTTIDKRTWQVETGGAVRVTLRYDLQAVDRSFGFFNTFLDENNGFVNGPAALMYVVDGKNAPCEITYRVPAGWKVASANTPTGDPHTFTAPGYDVLADQPADLGAFRRDDRVVAGVPIGVVLVGAGKENAQPFVDNVFRIAAAGIKVFGGAPFPRYLFHFRFGQRGGGQGLEHGNGTVIALGSRALRGTSGLSLVAHEFVHAWNIKRVRPVRLGPFDYTQEVRVKDLWWSEGVTEYYAPRLLVEAGLQSRPFWYAYLARAVTELQNNPARARVTLEQASLKAWEGGSEGFDGLSYYNKGMLVGLLLDIEMRTRTQNRVGLDDLMKHLLQQAQTSGKGFEDGAIEDAAGTLTRTNFGPFFQHALRATTELPFADTFARAGLTLVPQSTKTAVLGIALDRFTTDGVTVREVLPASAAEKAGLQAGDVVTKVDGAPVASLRGGLLPRRKPGETVRLTVRRGEGEQTLTARLGEQENTTYTLAEATNATALQKQILASLTGSASKPPRVAFSAGS